MGLKNLLFAVAQIAGVLCATSPIVLICGLGAADINIFFHNWVIYFVGTFITTIVSLYIALVV